MLNVGYCYIMLKLLLSEFLLMVRIVSQMSMLTISQVRQRCWLQFQSHHVPCHCNCFCSRRNQISEQTPSGIKVGQEIILISTSANINILRSIFLTEGSVTSEISRSFVKSKEDVRDWGLAVTIANFSECNQVLSMVGVRTQVDYIGQF